MAMPAQIKAQTEAVTKLYEQLNVDGDADGNPVTLNPDGDEPPVAAAVSDDDDNTPAAPAPAEPQGGADDTFEQKYKTLQGLYNAEVPRLRSQNQDLTTRLTNMEQLMAQMQTQPAEPQPAPVAQPVTLVTEDDISEYGDSIDVMRKVSREEAAALTSQLEAVQAQLANLQQAQTNLVPRVEQLATTQTQSAEQTFWQELTRAVPDWQTTNLDAGFQTWLLEIDPLTGVARQTYLDDAQRNLDARRVATFFTTWAAQSTAQPADPEPTTQSAPNAATSELEAQVAPGRGNSGNPPKPEGKSYTAAEIRKFYTDVQKGKYVGKDDERKGIERDIFAAQQEGRIVTA